MSDLDDLELPAIKRLGKLKGKVVYVDVDALEDEIERLRAALRDISHSTNAHWKIQAIAREALGDD